MRIFVACEISIHAPREGSDREVLDYQALCQAISIHAPREGSDLFHERTGYRALHFYPRSPRGERRQAVTGGIAWAAFLSTLPARGATPKMLM